LEGLEEKLLNFHVVLMAGAGWFILWVLRKVWKGMDDIGFIKRLKPIYPIILCEIFVWIPGILPDATFGEKILTALWSGFLAAIGYQLVRRFLRPHGIELPDNPDELASRVKEEINASTSELAEIKDNGEKDEKSN
jgi:hypothetical protein